MISYKSDCIFCKIVNKEISVRLEYDDKDVAAFADKNPHAPVHVVVVSKTHIVKMSETTEKDIRLLGQMLTVANKIAVKQKIADTGYRIVVNCGRDGGQAVDHLHLHLIGGRTLSWPPG